jgi:hypothetical protein
MIILVAVFLWLLPLSDMVYSFRTDAVTDAPVVSTSENVTTANVTLDKFVYDDDTDTISITSSINEVPAFSAYNGTSKTVTVASLTDNTSRTLSVTYDTDVITDNDAINTLLDRAAWIWMLIIIAFPAASLAAIWTNRA